MIAAAIGFYRDGLVRSFASIADVAIVGTAAAADEASALLRTARPHVVLVESTLPGARDFVRTIGALGYDARPVILAVRGSADDLLDWAEVGIAGYVSPQESLDELVGAVRQAARGRFPCSPLTAGRLLEHLGHVAATGPDRRSRSRQALTEREVEVLSLIDEGHSNKRIAASLGISTATVKNHVHRILVKLGVSRRGEAAARWRRPQFRPESPGRRRRYGGP